MLKQTKNRASTIGKMTFPDGTLVDVYMGYKATTKYVINWLQTIPGIGHGTLIKSTADICEAARKAAQQNREVPASVISSLRDCIKGRKTVMRLYRDQEQGRNTHEAESDDNHKAFIKRYCTPTVKAAN